MAADVAEARRASGYVDCADLVAAGWTEAQVCKHIAAAVARQAVQACIATSDPVGFGPLAVA